MISYAGRNRTTVNFLKTLYFDTPEWTPYVVSLMPATWMKYREDLEEVVLAHPRTFPGYEKGSKDFDEITNPLYEYGQHTDCWGIVWDNIEQGLDSIPIVHPLADWDALETYRPPDPTDRRPVRSAPGLGRRAAGRWRRPSRQAIWPRAADCPTASCTCCSTTCAASRI